MVPTSETQNTYFTQASLTKLTLQQIAERDERVQSLKLQLEREAELRSRSAQVRRVPQR